MRVRGLKSGEASSPRRSGVARLAPGLALLALVACSGGGGGGGSQPLDRPDVFLVLLDDAHRAHADDLVETRRLLDSHGFATVDFAHAYATTPLCCPSRASLLTGRYARNTGIRFNAEVPPGTPNGGAVGFAAAGLEDETLAVALRAAGYRTHLFGKYLNNYDDVLPEGRVPPGWDVWRARVRGLYTDYTLSEDGAVVAYGSADDDYLTDVLARAMRESIRSAPADVPLFVYFPSQAPHTPALPAARHRALHPGLEAPDTPNHPEADVSDKPSWVRGLAFTDEDEAAADRIHADGARCLASVDEAIALAIAEFERAGRLDRLLVIVTNDNGYCAGSHGWGEKRVAYEESASVTLRVASRDPRLVAASRGTDALVGLIDVAPTLYEIAGIAPPAPVDGVSFAPILRGESDGVRDDLVLEYWSDESPQLAVPTWCGLVTAAPPRWKYVEIAGGEVELYALDSDPFELENLADRPEHAATRAALESLKRLRVP